METVCVVMPTVRDFEVLREYLKNARQHGFGTNRLNVLFVTEDFCDKNKMAAVLKDEGIEGEIFDQRKRTQWLKQQGLSSFLDIIPNRSHAETSFGLLWMWANDFKYGIFIDDDTLPINQDYFGTHIKNLNFEGDIDTVSSDKKWVNVLYQNFVAHRLYPRGYPYSCMGEQINIESSMVKDVVASQGLWINNPDLDAIRILIDGGLDGRGKTLTNTSDFKNNFVVKKGNYLTISSMNLAFKREAIPCFYQLPMDDNSWKIGRFDDIWSGLFLKKASDILGKAIINGFPLCAHNKSPRSTFKDLNAEVPALAINEFLWKVIDEYSTSANSYFDIYYNLADNLENSKINLVNGDFVNFMAKKMKIWLKCLEVIE